MPVPNSDSLRSDDLFERYAELVGEWGSDGVLALVEGGTRAAWLDRVAGGERAEDRIFTFGSWVRRELTLWWPLAEAGLAADGREPDPGVPSEPLFVQADVAQGLMAAFTCGYRDRERAFADARTPEALRYVQLGDVLAAAVEQGLTLPEAEQLLLAGCGNPDEAAQRRHVRGCLEVYRDGMLRARLLDRALAAWIFERYVLPGVAYQAHLRRTVRALVVEVAAQPQPWVTGVLATLSGLLGERVSGGMAGGASAATSPAIAGGALGRLAAALVADDGSAGVPLETFRGYPEMLGRVSDVAIAEAEAGRRVAILVPGMTPLLAWWFKRALGRASVPLVVTAGTNRLTDYAPVRVALALAAHAFPGEGGTPVDPDLWQDALDALDGDAGRIEAWADAARAVPRQLAGVFRLAFGQLLAPAGRTADAWQAADEIAQLVRTAERFEAADSRIGGNWGRSGDGVAGLAGIVWRFREFLLAGHFAERPQALGPRPAVACVQLSTLHRFAAGGEAADRVLLVDASAQAWLRSGARELCNVHVLDRSRPTGPYSPGEDRSDARLALARVLQRAAALASGSVRAFAALVDAEGSDQPGGLADFCEPAGTPEEVAV